MESSELAQETMGSWSVSIAKQRLAERWTPKLLGRLTVVVRRSLKRFPESAKHFGLVPSMRRVIEASEETRHALCSDPALARWTGAMEQCLDAKTPTMQTLQPLMALCPRFAVAAAILEKTDLDVAVIMGSEGVGRIPVIGQLIQGEIGPATRIIIGAGELLSPARECARLGDIQVIGGDADGGMMPALQALGTRKSWEAKDTVLPAIEMLLKTAPVLFEELSTLAPVIIPIVGTKHVSQSASLPNVRGCIWMSCTHEPLVLAETLLHEASHLKYYLAEDCASFTFPHKALRVHVPWRPDSRPLGAVLMGLHAWIRVSQWLSTLLSGPWAEAACERLNILKPAIREGLSSIASHASGLTPHGEALLACLYEAETRLDDDVG